MENFDPVGVHTGDSIVAVPTQTLTDKENQMLRSASINIIRKMKIQGGCNVQFALDTVSMSYFVIEVNPRVSRSSALASKATGYPIARLAAKIALGYTLDELKNPVTGVSSAFFEPVIDYVVVKIPKWPFDKFTGLSRKLNTQMKATGEVMAMDRSFEGALLKAVRALEMDNKGLYLKQIKSMGNQELLERLKNPDDLRIWIIAEAARRKWRKEFIEEISGVNKWFISKLFNIVEFENVLRDAHLNEEIIRIAKKMGFSDEEIGFFAERSPEDVKLRRLELGIIPSTKPVDTCSGEFDSVTAYYYNTYNGVNEIAPIEEKNVLVLGSGPIRIGQGIEFDYCAVHSAQAVKKLGYKSIMLNNNPETVSTDYDCSDRLYFEPITFEDAMNIIEKEKPEGVLVQFGGQTAIKMAGKLHKAGVKILGTSFEGIDLAEDRKKFDYLMEQLGIKRPKGAAASDMKEAIEIAKKLGYPLMVRPSYVIGGQNMLVVHNTNELLAYLDGKIITDREPLLMDEYIVGIEVEIDALCDGERVFIPGIMEHIEPTGVHSGDSMSVYPSMNLSDEIKKELVKVTKSLGIALCVKGHLNVQFAVRGTEVFVIEANPRASRTIPIISKIAAFPMVEIATGIALGKTLPELGVHEEYKEPEGIFAVTAPVFSFEKLSGMDCVLGPEMKSTGEVLGVSSNYEEALAKAFIAVGASYTKKGKFLAGFSGSTEAWEDGIKGLTPLGFDFVDLNDVLKENPNLDSEDRDQFKSYLINNGYSYFISDSRADIIHRKWAVEAGVQCFTSPATLAAFSVYWNYIAEKGELTPYKFSLN